MYLLWQLAPVKNHQIILKKYHILQKIKYKKNDKRIKQHNFFQHVDKNKKCILRDN